MNLKKYFDADGAIFMGSSRNPDNCNVGIYGVPYDGTTSFRPGSRFGPSSVRQVSNGIESYCPELNKDLNDINYSDFGSLKIPYGSPAPIVSLVNKITSRFLNAQIKPLMIGGEHSVSIGAINAVFSKYPEVILIQIDAHADLRNEWLGSTYNHACTIRRCLDFLPSNQLFQIGIRSGTKDEFKEMRKEKRLISCIPGERPKNLEEVLSSHKGKPIYLTVDLDWFDPSVFPGTGTPEPGGFFWRDFSNIINILKNHNLIAADIVELAPQLDNSEISSILAAKTARSILLLLAK